MDAARGTFQGTSQHQAQHHPLQVHPLGSIDAEQHNQPSSMTTLDPRFDASLGAALGLTPAVSGTIAPAGPARWIPVAKIWIWF